MRPPYVSRVLLLTLVAPAVCALVAAASVQHGHEPSALADPEEPVRGQVGDLWADVILGQPDFSEINPGPIVPDKLWLPHGVIVDNARGKFYVFDAGDNRILGFDDSCLDPEGTRPCVASLVLGQGNCARFDEQGRPTCSACNGDSAYQSYPDRAPASAGTLCGLHESQLSIAEGGSGASMALDSAGNIYVSDFWNRRVLKYNYPFATGEDPEADDVWGQNDFAGNSCNKGMATADATSLCFTWGSSNNWTAGVDIGPDGALWVADSGNNRVLRFPAGSKTADLVLGQQDFDTGSPGTAPNEMWDPSAVRVREDGRVYVAEHGNKRVTYFNPPLASGMAAIKLLPFPPEKNGPSGIDFDPTQEGIWITNEGNNTLDLWDEDLNNKNAEVGSPGDGNVLGDASGSVGIDSQGDLLVAIGTGDHSDDVLLFQKTWSNPPTYSNTHEMLFNVAPRVRTSRDFVGSVPGVEWSGSPPNDLGIGSQLVIADAGRILFWNNPDPATMSSHDDADGYLDWLSCNYAGECQPVISGFNDSDGAGCSAMNVSDNHLWVAMSRVRDDPDRILVYELPLESGDLPVKEIKLPLPVLGGGQIEAQGTFDALWGLAPSRDGEQLWISQANASRGFRVRHPLSETPVVDAVLGQTSASGTQCNRGGAATADALCNPGSLSFDRLGNLYVSDHSLEIRGNMRLLEFDADIFPSNNDIALYAPAASKVFPDVATWEPAFNSANQMVVGYNPYHGSNPEPPGEAGECVGWCNARFPGVYNDPLGPSTTPDSFLKDYYSMAFAASFDDQGNLYVSTNSRSSVLVYKEPLAGGPTPTPTSTPPPTFTPTRTPVPTSTATRTPTASPMPPSECRGDANNDGHVNWRDMLIVIKALSTRPGQPRWNPAADVNGDLRVGTRDVMIVLRSMLHPTCW